MMIAPSTALAFLILPLVAGSVLRGRSLAEAKCVTEGGACFDPQTLTIAECCSPFQCYIDKTSDDFVGTCTPPLNFTQALAELKLDYAVKDTVCNNLESTLDNYYETIQEVLSEIQEDPGDNQMGLLVNLVCKNSDPNDPGIRDHASYTRFDYSHKCAAADAAYCEVKLAEAIKYEKLLFRKIDLEYGEMGRISYKVEGPNYIDSLVNEDGYVIEVDCLPIEESPFLYKPLPFNPETLNATCGDAGYDYYVE